MMPPSQMSALSNHASKYGPPRSSLGTCAPSAMQSLFQPNHYSCWNQGSVECKWSRILRWKLGHHNLKWMISRVNLSNELVLHAQISHWSLMFLCFVGKELIKIVVSLLMLKSLCSCRLSFPEMSRWELLQSILLALISCSLWEPCDSNAMTFQGYRLANQQ